MKKDHEFDLFPLSAKSDEDREARDALSAARIWYGPKASNPYLRKPVIVEAKGASRRQRDRIRAAALGISVPRRFASQYTARHDKVIAVVSYLTRLPLDKIVTVQRSNRAALDARCAIAALLFNKFNYSTTHIGRILKRDHSTIIHNLRNLTPEARKLIHKASAMLFEAAS